LREQKEEEMNAAALLSRLKSLWRHLFDRRQIEKELDEEIRSHLELLTEQTVNDWPSPSASLRQQ
jgi:hypothetical protein